MFDNERIKVGNSFICVTNYELHESEELEAPFMVFNPVNHKLELHTLYYDKENKCMYLPMVDIWWVRRCLGEKYYQRLDANPYKTFEPVQIKYKPRDERQVEFLKFMVGLEDYSDNADKNQLSLNAGTGSGKTYCSIATICYFRINSMIITASNSLLTQWEKNILEYTSMNSKDICRISGSDMCNMILMGNSNKANNAKIFLCSHGTLRSFGDRYGWDKVNQLFLHLGIGLKFYDEVHSNFDNCMMIDYFTNVYKTYYVTATPGRSNWKEDKIFQISLKNVPAISLFVESEKRTSYIAVKWNSNPTPQVISACKSRMYGLDRNKYMEWLTKNPEFYKMLHVMMHEMVMPVLRKGQRVLMYIGTNNGILRVYHWIAETYPELIRDIGVFTSLVSKEDKLKEREKRLLLSTTKSAGLGEHIEGLKMTIVLAEPFKSEILARQTLGRTRDNNTIYIEMVDLGFIYTRKFYTSKISTFNKYAKDVSDMTIDKYELNRRNTSAEEDEDKWQRCPLRLADNRFNFEGVLPQNDSKISSPYRCPISFHKKHQNPNNGNL